MENAENEVFEISEDPTIAKIVCYELPISVPYCNSIGFLLLADVLFSFELPTEWKMYLKDGLHKMEMFQLQTVLYSRACAAISISRDVRQVRVIIKRCAFIVLYT